MNNRELFRGTGVALITPMMANGSIDFAALARTVERLIEGNVDYILTLGTTSENPTLTAAERQAVMRFVRDRVAGRVPLMVGIGGNCTASVIETMRSWDFTGYSAILSVNPYYNKPNQEGLFRHFMALAEVAPLPIVLYNIPGRTGVNMLPETVARLSYASDRFIGIKEASGNIEQMEEICRLLPDFLVISGDDALTVECIKRGGCGVLSVAAHLYPQQISDLTHLALDGKIDEAHAAMERLLPIIDSLFAEGNPVGVKSALAIKGVCEATVRLPLAEASDALVQHQKQLINQYEADTKA